VRAPAIVLPFSDGTTHRSGGGGFLLNVAVIDFAPSTVIVQAGDVPEHAPAQPAKLESGAAVATNVALVPEVKVAVHVAAPHSEIVVPFAVTVPVPLPIFVIETEYDFLLNVAESDFGPSTVTVQIVEVPEHAPPQPANSESGAGVATNVLVPAIRVVVHVAAPHSEIVAPFAVTVPVPAPSFVTETA
jgi:hypothetical protein